MVHVGLVRHFPVTEPFPTGWPTSAELQAWRERYDLAPAQVGPCDLGAVTWRECLSSDMARTRATAVAVFPGEVAYTPLLREADFAPFPTGGLRLPVLLWRGLLRLAWLTGHASQRACRDDLRRRVGEVADLLCAAERDTLVVSHAGMLAYLSAELRRRGFVGPRLGMARHATAYVYRR